MKRHIIASALSAALFLAPLTAMAGDNQAVAQADLAPGPAAGVQNAQGMYWGGPWPWVAAGVAVAAVIIVASNGGGNHGSVSTSTTGHP